MSTDSMLNGYCPGAFECSQKPGKVEVNVFENRVTSVITISHPNNGVWTDMLRAREHGD